MLEYSAINSSGWLLRNRPWVVLVTGATLIGATVTMLSLLRFESDEKQRQSPQPFGGVVNRRVMLDLSGRQPPTILANHDVEAPLIATQGPGARN